MTQARLLGGRYQVGELLGYGGMAEVHRGRDLRLGRDVAIKMLRTDLARDDTFQMRFRREAQNAASLNHPAIVAVYDTGEEIAPTGETLPFIVMEFVNGRTLKEVLAAEGRLMPRRALEITADVCAALEFSHRHGIIHRDIKPGNVMMTLNGQVKVMDFGIARALASGATTMTQTSAVIGTAQYLSPEQARGEAVDARSDVYAAGCVLFELLCGHPPFVGDSPVSVAYQHVREEPPSPGEINQDVTPPVEAIVLKALSKNPLNRYQSAGEMRADLLRAAAGRPVLATPVLREEDETVTMASAGARPGASTKTATMAPARVGAPRRRRASAWVLATLSALGVLAVVALVSALLLSQRDDGDELVAVPDVVNQAPEAAERQIVSAGLQSVRGDSQADDTCQEGRVASQFPAAGTEVKANEPVTIRICSGRPEVTVPENLVGSQFNLVRDTLKNLGLEVERQNVDNEAEEGQVVELEPKSGASVPKESTVVVRVSKGNVREVPDVVGRGANEARRILSEAGFDDVRAIEGSSVPADQIPGPGTVEAQNPRAGSKQVIGTAVSLTVRQEQQEEPDPGIPTDPPTPTPPPDDDGGGGIGGGGTGGLIPTIPTVFSREP